MATFWKELHNQLTVCSLGIISICTFSYFQFMIFVMILPVPGHCFFYFSSSDKLS